MLKKINLTVSDHFGTCIKGLSLAQFMNIENATIWQFDMTHGFLKEVFNSLKFWEKLEGKQKYTPDLIIRNIGNKSS